MISNCNAIFNQSSRTVDRFVTRIAQGNCTTISSEVQLDGSVSEGTGLTYLWRSLGKTAAIYPRDLNTPKINVQFAEGLGEYTFELTVTDAAKNASTARVTIFYAGR